MISGVYTLKLINAAKGLHLTCQQMVHGTLLKTVLLCPMLEIRVALHE